MIIESVGLLNKTRFVNLVANFQHFLVSHSFCCIRLIGTFICLPTSWVQMVNFDIGCWVTSKLYKSSLQVATSQPSDTVWLYSWNAYTHSHIMRKQPVGPFTTKGNRPINYALLKYLIHVSFGNMSWIQPKHLWDWFGWGHGEGEIPLLAIELCIGTIQWQSDSL